MRAVETVVVSVNRPFDETYSLLSDPRNFPRWSPMPGGLFEPVDEDDRLWRVELPRGVRLMRFARPNALGVLDYVVLSEAMEIQYTAYLRLLPNDAGCSLVAHYLQRPGLSDEAFRSEVEWAANDLRAAMLVIEALV